MLTNTPEFKQTLTTSSRSKNFGRGVQVQAIAHIVTLCKARAVEHFNFGHAI